MGLIKSAVLGVTIVVAGGVAFALSGAYNVAATAPHTAPVRWLLEETMDRSVEARSGAIEVPPLEDPKMIRTGYEHYRENCEVCHAAPGAPVSEIATGLEPPPPNLTEADDDEDEEPSPAELFWVTKNGIKMTGMPAWGPTHDDDEIWAIVVFLRKLPGMTPQEYAALGREAGNDHHQRGPSAHEHDEHHERHERGEHRG
jgi:mono/diheme cytochrome c family protein